MADEGQNERGNANGNGNGERLVRSGPVWERISKAAVPVDNPVRRSPPVRPHSRALAVSGLTRYHYAVFGGGLRPVPKSESGPDGREPPVRLWGADIGYGYWG